MDKGIPREDDTSRGVKRDEKHGEQAGEEKRQKTKGTGEGSIEDLEEMIGRDRGQASKKANTSDPREDEGMTITVSDAPSSKRELEGSHQAAQAMKAACPMMCRFQYSYGMSFCLQFTLSRSVEKHQ